MTIEAFDRNALTSPGSDCTKASLPVLATVCRRAPRLRLSCTAALRRVQTCNGPPPTDASRSSS